MLSDLALRSKGYWGYDPEFLEACRADLTLSEDYLASGRVFVAEDQGKIAGFYGLETQGSEATLAFLFVEPEAIGQGFGKQLLQHALELARTLGCVELLVESDPNAERFYEAMGATRIGSVPSTVAPGRELPLMRFSLAAAPLLAEVRRGAETAAR
jgi:GNAT superfamily N-acetyltransferase